MSGESAKSVEIALLDALGRADRTIAGVPLVLSHMLESPGQSLVTEVITARVRGMLNDMARQMLDIQGQPHVDDTAREAARSRLVVALAADTRLLSHCHALALETQLADRLKHRCALDPVLSDLWQELIASDNPASAELAMKALAAQSRFVQTQRRMQHPLSELPPELLEQALRIWARHSPVESEAAIVEGARILKAEYDEGKTRIGLISRLIAGMRGGAIAALELEHAGLSLFAGALASLTGQDRARAVLACHPGQAARLALGLRASGLDGEAMDRQFQLLESAEYLPVSLAGIAQERAADLLSRSQLDAGLSFGAAEGV